MTTDEAQTLSENDIWKPWHEERERFFKKPSHGFTADLEALKAHILKLQELAPKDKAGWLDWHATELIRHLQNQYEDAIAWQKAAEL